MICVYEVRKKSLYWKNGWHTNEPNQVEGEKETLLQTFLMVIRLMRQQTFSATDQGDPLSKMGLSNSLYKKTRPKSTQFLNLANEQ